MKRINHCTACNFIIAGVKSRRAIEHTCGKTQQEIMEFIIKHNQGNVLKNVKTIKDLTNNGGNNG